VFDSSGRPRNGNREGNLDRGPGQASEGARTKSRRESLVRKVRGIFWCLGILNVGSMAPKGTKYCFLL